MDLHDAAREGDAARIRELLDSGQDADALDRWENTPLLLACFSETAIPEVVALLRDAGADPYRRNVHWETPRLKAHQRLLLSGFDHLADLPAPDPPETEAGELSDEELAVVTDAVRTVVDQDRAALETMDAFAGGGDPYSCTRDYGRWGDVHLVMPPGDPRAWAMHVLRADDESWTAVDVEMWTREEGRSDLTLQLELRRDPEGSLRAGFETLHVL